MSYSSRRAVIFGRLFKCGQRIDAFETRSLSSGSVQFLSFEDACSVAAFQFSVIMSVFRSDIVQCVQYVSSKTRCRTNYRATVKKFCMLEEDEMTLGAELAGAVSQCDFVAKECDSIYGQWSVLIL